MKKFIQEFKTFINKGNALNLAIGVVIGNAFTAITNSLVKDIITPIIGIITGGVSIDDWKIVLKPANAELGTAEVAVLWGKLLQNIINFFIIALSIFLVVKIINRSREFIEKTSNDILNGLNEKETEKKLIKELKKKGVNVKDSEILKVELEKIKQEKLEKTLEEKKITPPVKPTIEVINETLLDIKALLKEVKQPETTVETDNIEA